MDAEAKYWKDKWTEAQQEIQALTQILKDQFDWLDGRESTTLIREEKKYGKQRPAKKSRFL